MAGEQQGQSAKLPLILHPVGVTQRVEPVQSNPALPCPAPASPRPHLSVSTHSEAPRLTLAHPGPSQTETSPALGGGIEEP